MNKLIILLLVVGVLLVAPTYAIYLTICEHGGGQSTGKSATTFYILARNITLNQTYYIQNVTLYSRGIVDSPNGLIAEVRHDCAGEPCGGYFCEGQIDDGDIPALGEYTVYFNSTCILNHSQQYWIVSTGIGRAAQPQGRIKSGKVTGTNCTNATALENINAIYEGGTWSTIPYGLYLKVGLEETPTPRVINNTITRQDNTLLGYCEGVETSNPIRFYYKWYENGVLKESGISNSKGFAPYWPITYSFTNETATIGYYNFNFSKVVNMTPGLSLWEVAHGTGRYNISVAADWWEGYGDTFIGQIKSQTATQLSRPKVYYGGSWNAKGLTYTNASAVSYTADGASLLYDYNFSTCAGFYNNTVGWTTNPGTAHKVCETRIHQHSNYMIPGVLRNVDNLSLDYSSYTDSNITLTFTCAAYDGTYKSKFVNSSLNLQLYGNMSVHFLDVLTGFNITESINVRVTSANYDSNFSTNTSQFTLNNLTYGDYTITAGSDSYSNRQATLSIYPFTINTTTMYLLNSSSSVYKIIRLIDEDSKMIESATIRIQRQSGLNWLTVNELITNFEGETTSDFEEDQVYYRFLVYVNGILVKTTEKTFISSLKTTLTIQVELTEDQLTSLRYWQGATTNLTLNNISGTFWYNFTWSGSNIKGGRLRITQRILTSDDIIVAQKTVYSPFGNIALNFSPAPGITYFGEGYIDTNTTGSWYMDQLGEYKINNPVQIFGVFGLLIVFLIIGVFASMKSDHPAGVIIMVLVGLVLGSLVGFISIAWGFIVLLIAVGGIILFTSRL